MINIAIPKGSLEEETISLFRKADLRIIKDKKEYSPRIIDRRIDKVKILRPQEIPTYVEDGYFDIGITGHDWVIESRAEVMEVTDLCYSKQGVGDVRIVIAVSEDEDIKSAKEIKPDSRIATEYPNITKIFFDGLGIPVNISFSYGATEAKVPDLMDAIVDVCETGETLRRNGLKIIETIMTSSTKLIANRESLEEERRKKEIEEIKTLLLGVIEANGKVLLKMNVEEEMFEEVIGILPAMRRPTVSKLYGEDYYAVESVVEKNDVNVLIPKLKDAGAEDIIELDISKIVR
jgi:ATP phosphoribosyltransferase